MSIYQTVSPPRLNAVLASSNGLAVTGANFARRAELTPVSDQTNGSYSCEIPVPLTGVLQRISVRFSDGSCPAGEMFISPVDPLQSYPAFFLYAITDPILPATSGVPIYRRAELDGCGYNTKNLTQGILYLLWCPKGKSAAAGDDITYDPPTSTSVDVSLVVAVDGGE